MRILVNCAHFSKKSEIISLLPRALLPGFGGGKSALDTRLRNYASTFCFENTSITMQQTSKCQKKL